MMQAFEPIMEEQNVETTADYYYDVFVPLGGVAPAMSQENIDRFNAYLEGFGGLEADAQLLIPALATATGVTEEQAQAFVASQFPAMAQMLQTLPDMQEDFTSLLGLMAANLMTEFMSNTATTAMMATLVKTRLKKRGLKYSSICVLTPDTRNLTPCIKGINVQSWWFLFEI